MADQDLFQGRLKTNKSICINRYINKLRGIVYSQMHYTKAKYNGMTFGKDEASLM